MRDRASYISASLTLLLMSFGVSMIFAHLSSNEDLRDYNLYMPMLAAIGHLALFGQAAGTSVLVFGTSYRDMDKSRLTVTSVVAVIAASFVLVVGSIIYAQVAEIGVALSVSVALAASGLALRDYTINLLQITRSVRALQIFSLTALCVIVGTLYVCPTFEIFLIANISLLPIGLFTLSYHVHRQGGRLWPPDKKLALHLFSEGWPSMPSVFLAGIFAFGIRSIAESDLTLSEFNAVAFAMTIGASVVGGVLRSYFRTDTIAMSEAIAASQDDGARDKMGRIHWTVLAICILAFIAPELGGDIVVTTVFGERFSGYAWVFSLFVIVSAINLSSGVYALFLQFKRRMLLASTLSLIGPAMSLILVYAWWGALSIVSICLASVLGATIAAATMIAATKKFRPADRSAYLFLTSYVVLALLLLALNSGL